MGTSERDGQTATTSPRKFAADDRYVVVSSDCHAGASVDGYRPYLESRWHDEFDAWRNDFIGSPYPVEFRNGERDWDSALRLRELEQQGVAAEVVFPNTVPPFFPLQSFVSLQPPKSRADYERRWAGLKAHNRWLADFCAEAPNRRAGVGQVMLNDLDEAVTELEWFAKVGLPSVLLPGVPPASDLPQLYDPSYEPLWAACADLGIVVGNHGAGGTPDYDLSKPVEVVVFLMEIKDYGRRMLTQLMFSGVFERHPTLRFAMTEQGTGWLVNKLEVFEMRHRLMRQPGTQEYEMCAAGAAALPTPPREIFARNVFIGSSFMHRCECDHRYEIGVDRIMFGVDYPHIEGTYPYTTEALRSVFAGLPPEEVQPMVGETAAKLYGFDWAGLQEVADRIGPTVGEVAVPLTDPPTDTVSPTFDPGYALDR